MIKITTHASSSRGNCYTVTDGATTLLLEAGIPFRKMKKALNHELFAVAGCLISHGHFDHSKASEEIMASGINLYTSAGTAEKRGLSGHRLKIIKAKEPFQVGTWNIMPFGVEHDCKEPLGFLLVSDKGRVLFLTDSAFVRYRFSGLTNIMIECNYQTEILERNIEKGIISASRRKRLPFSHFSLGNVLDFLAANDLSKVVEIHLLHLSDQNANEDQMVRAVQGATGKPVFVANKEENAK